MSEKTSAPSRPATTPTPGRTDHDSSSLRFERRSRPRRDVAGKASLFPLDGDQFGDILELDLVDYADGGFAALSDRPIEPGTQVTVGFEDPRLVAWRGIVLRCERGLNDDRYRVAVRFKASLAA